MPRLLGVPQWKTARTPEVEEGEGTEVATEVEAGGGGALFQASAFPGLGSATALHVALEGTTCASRPLRRSLERRLPATTGRLLAAFGATMEIAKRSLRQNQAGLAEPLSASLGVDATLSGAQPSHWSARWGFGTMCRTLNDYASLHGEAGHALVGSLMPEYDPVAKISIIPRGHAGGLTFCAPSEERLESGLYNRSYLENQMVVALGGRVAEEVIFRQDNVTTRASTDFMHVSRVARQMVERFGLMYPFWQ
ncbi:ATP-dependent zinc metalloprotease FTSH protein [Hordeum vulgare]|nr:ATP-dependent zinc metalloprotease FTSH protein [Hordeum vulgare]